MGLARIMRTFPGNDWVFKLPQLYPNLSKILSKDWIWIWQQSDAKNQTY